MEGGVGMTFVDVRPALHDENYIGFIKVDGTAGECHICEIVILSGYLHKRTRSFYTASAVPRPFVITDEF